MQISHVFLSNKAISYFAVMMFAPYLSQSMLFFSTVGTLEIVPITKREMCL